eukprot:m51a1_g7600 putative dna 3 phosphatase (486) ;mRNA; f:234084-236185
MSDKASLTKLTVAVLRQRCSERGLSTSGLKADLVARLSESPAQPSPSGSDSDHTSRRGTKRAAADVEKKEEDEEEESEQDEEEEGAAESPAKRARGDSGRAAGAWKKDGTLLVYAPDAAASDAIVSFDMDDTLIKTKSGKVFATNRGDWQWLYSCVPAKLKQLSSEGKRLVIFTNQSGINGTRGYDTSKERAICGKIEDIIAELGVPATALVATTDDVYRKPATEMWDYLVRNHSNGTQPDLAKCLFVGDAAGRPERKDKAGNKVKKDFSCSDRKFARNIGIDFKTPEEFFLGEAPEPFAADDFDPSAIPTNGEICEGGVATLTSEKQELVLFVGFPASGKSTLARTYMVPKGYAHVNRDTLKTQDKCLKFAKQALAEGKSVVVDNTNPAKDVRAQYIKAAKEAGVPVRCFRFNVDEQLAQHLNYFRERITNGASKHVPRIGYATYKKALQEPELSEGFSEIKRINFVANLFGSDDERASFSIVH